MSRISLDRVPGWALPAALGGGALLLFDVGRYIVSGVLSAVVLAFALVVVLLLLGMLVVLALPHRRRTAAGYVPLSASEAIGEYVRAVLRTARAAPWRRPSTVLARASQRASAQVAELPTGRSSFSHVEVRMSSRTLKRLDAWMPLEDLASQIAAGYAQANRGLPRGSEAITVVLVRDDRMPLNRPGARGSFRRADGPDTVALARCALAGPLHEFGGDLRTVIRFPGESGADRDSAGKADEGGTVASGAGLTQVEPDRTDRLTGGAVQEPGTTVLAVSDRAAATQARTPAGQPTVLANLRLFPYDVEAGAASGAHPVRIAGSSATVGRRPGSTLHLVQGHVSRRHAELRRDARGWTVQDVGSSLGTFVNGDLVDPVTPRRLTAGDVIEFGRPRDASERPCAFLVA